MNKVDFSSYWDDNIPYVIRKRVKQVINTLKETWDEIFYWFADNQLRINPGKCHLLTGSCNEVSICVDNYSIKSSKCEKLNNKLNFITHVDGICKKAVQKLNALSRVIHYMDLLDVS